jgi:hypothetical protein
MIHDVPATIAFYTSHQSFGLDQDAFPAFAAVSRHGVQLLLSGKASSGRRPMPDGSEPVLGGWNRIQLVVEDIAAEVERLRSAGLRFRNEVISGPGARRPCSMTPRAILWSSSSLRTD